MKNPIKAILLLAVLLFQFNCQDNFLEVAPASSLSFNELSSKEGIEGALIGTYSMLLGRNGFYGDGSNWLWGSIMGGDANKGSTAGDQSIINEIQAFNAQSNNPAILQKYRSLYEGVARANTTLRLLQNAEEKVTPADRIRIEAEARFLRAHYYFELKKIFNNTPYVDEYWDEVTPVRNDKDLWPFIEADFQFAFEQLPETQAQLGRANKWAAGAYLAKAYLYQNNFSSAKAVFDQVISNGVTTSGEKLGLLPNYPDAFHSIQDNSRESLFATQAAVSTGSVVNANLGMVLNFPLSGSDGPGGCCGFFQPSLELANSFRTNVDGLPLLDETYNLPQHHLINDLSVSSDEEFIMDKGNLDPRLDHSIGRRGIPYLDWGLHPGKNWIRDQAYAGPYSPKKFSYFRSGIGIENDLSSWTPGFTAVNYTIIRFADVLLMAAEAEIELNDLEKARDYINRVRSRAKNSNLIDTEANYVIDLYPPFENQSQARLAVRFERKLELAMEGHRFYDLIRWGVAEETLNFYLQYEDQFITPPFAGARFTAGKNEYLPLPQTEIDLQGADIISQNPGY